MEGWIKLHRKIVDNPYYFSEPFTRSQAWIDLLILANHKDNFYYMRGVKVDVNRGQIGMSLENLAKRWRWSRGKAERFLTVLESSTQVIRQKTNVTTLISIVNYDEYQQGSKADNKANSKADSKANGQQTVKQTDTNKNVNNVKNEKNVKNNSLPETSSGEQVNDILLKTENGIDVVNAKPVVKTKPEKKPKKAVPENVRILRADMKKIFMDHYKLRFGHEFYWSPKDATSLIKLVSQIDFKVQEKRPDEENRDESTKQAFEFILANIKDNFIINNLSIPMISSKFNEIYTEITNPNLAKNGKKESAYQSSTKYRTQH